MQHARARPNVKSAADKLTKNTSEKKKKRDHNEKNFILPAAKWDFFEMQISGARLVNFSCCQHHNKIQMWLFV